MSRVVEKLKPAVGLSAYSTITGDCLARAAAQENTNKLRQEHAFHGFLSLII